MRNKVLFEDMDAATTARILVAVDNLADHDVVGYYTAKDNGRNDVTVVLQDEISARAFLVVAELYCCNGKVIG